MPGGSTCRWMRPVAALLMLSNRATSWARGPSTSREIKRPWEVGKAFAASAPCGRVFPASKIGHPDKGAIWLDVNGERKQSADVQDLIWNIPETIEHLSALFTLEPGDLIYTGTPAGVGPIKPGDVMHGFVEGVGEITTKVV